MDNRLFVSNILGLYKHALVTITVYYQQKCKRPLKAISDNHLSTWSRNVYFIKKNKLSPSLEKQPKFSKP